MSEPEEIAQEQLREIVRELEATRFRLLGVQASLPLAPEELVRPLEMEVMDTATQLRAVIQCVVDDFLRPAIRDLGAAARLGQESSSA